MADMQSSLFLLGDHLGGYYPHSSFLALSRNAPFKWKMNPKSDIFRAQFKYSSSLRSREIRLLDLEWGRLNQSIRFSLRTYPLDSTPDYIALSYTWGDPKDTVPVLCDGKTMNVTRNLDEALRQLRESRKALTKEASREHSFNQLLFFWVDAVCINQEDSEEKAYQVRLMWNIYHHAHLVVAWLGKQDKTCKNGVELLDKMNDFYTYELSRLDKGLESREDNQVLSMSAADKFGFPHFISEQWDCLFDILTRQWFSRVWIIQELVASRKCIFLLGCNIITSDRILRVGRLIEEKKFFSSLRNFRRERVLASNIASMDVLKRADGHHADLLELLWSTHPFRATNPRDRVFALLNMASLDSESISSLIDYKLHSHEVFTNTARLCLQRGSLDVLSYAQAFGDLYSLPSWVPHWGASDYSYEPLIRGLNPTSPSTPVRDVEECSWIVEDEVS